MKYLKKFNEASFDRTEEFIKLANNIINYDESEYEQGDEPSNTDILSELGDLCNELTFTSEELQKVIDSGRISDPNKFLQIILDETLRDEDAMENETPATTKSGTKVLFVTGEDYSALSFERENAGSLVSDIIDNIQDYESDEWELSVHEFGEIDPNFVKFIKNKIQDYDMSKDTNFYLETEKLKR
jgi:MoaA/NifB/PqqE/SkfB family radical SAM enzyme